MKRAMYLLIAGTVLSGIAAYSASGRSAAPVETPRAGTVVATTGG